MVYVSLYLLLCIMAGLLGKQSRLGFWGVTVASIFITPVMGFLLVIIFGRRGSFS